MALLTMALLTMALLTMALLTMALLTMAPLTMAPLTWLYLHECEDGAAPRAKVEGQHQPQRAARHDDETPHHKGRYHLAVTSLGELEGGGGTVEAVTAEGQALALAVRGAACDRRAADCVAPGMVGGAIVSGASRAKAGPYYGNPYRGQPDLTTATLTTATRSTPAVRVSLTSYCLLRLHVAHLPSGSAMQPP
eukprot:scaffold48131_cov45-Phaeocystis_antarctica.AAC.2